VVDRIVVALLNEAFEAVSGRLPARSRSRIPGGNGDSQ